LPLFLYPAGPGLSEQAEFDLDRIVDLTLPEIRVLQDATGRPFSAVRDLGTGEVTREGFQEGLYRSDVDCVAALVSVLWKRAGHSVKPAAVAIRWSDWDVALTDAEKAEQAGEEEPPDPTPAGDRPAPSD
jgi:hypothetical protein